jgi:hypothetical protein
VKNVTAYNGLNVRGMAAGTSYADPVTGVRVWKATSATVPSANSYAVNLYSEGPTQVSREWAPGRHTVLTVLSSGAFYLGDFQRGVGFSNWRPLPGGSTHLTFSKNAATPRIAYITTSDGRLRRYDTGTNSWADTGLFPAAFNSGNGVWLQQDRNDRWFVALGAVGGSVIAWNSQTGELRSRTVSGLDEPYFDKDGRYVFMNHGSTTSTIWDLQSNTTYGIRAPGASGFGHMPALRSFFLAADVNTGNGIMPIWRLDPTPAGNHVQIGTFNNGYSPDFHWSGQWLQDAGELPNEDLTRQWALVSTFNETFTATGGGVKEGIGLMRLDGSDLRLLAHHYSTNFGGGDLGYWSQPHATTSPDGKLVLFSSSMLGSGRADLFAIEVPTR